MRAAERSQSPRWGCSSALRHLRCAKRRDVALWLEGNTAKDVYMLLCVCVVKKSVVQSLECIWRKLSRQNLELFLAL